MSGGKKKYAKKKTYTEGELKHHLKASRDDIVMQLMYLFINAASDVFGATEDQLVDLMNRAMRYNSYIESGLVTYDVAAESIKKKTGIDLRLRRW